MAGALSMRWRDFSMRRATISSLCPSICSCRLQLSPILSASCSLTACRVRTTKRQGCRPCGEGAQRAASRTCSMSSRGTGRACYRAGLYFISVGVALSPVVNNRLHARYAYRHVDLTVTPWPTPGIRDDNCNIKGSTFTCELLQAHTQLPSRAVRIKRQQCKLVLAVDVRFINACVGTDEAMLCLSN